MTTTSYGRAAEQMVCERLLSLGFVIVAQNWRTRYCEIDIVAKRGKTVFFVEVKFRKNMAHGSGLEYITPKKLRQMQFAAELWVQTHNWHGPYQLAAAGVDGTEITLIDDL